MVIDKKGLIFFGLVFAFILGFFILIGGIFFSKQEVCYVYSMGVETVNSQDDLPLPKPSKITSERDKIRLDLERVTVHKFYIVYSKIYGDQSHTAYHLFLTDLKRKELELDQVKSIWLEMAGGEKIELVAEPTVYDYPKDQPLKWKIGIIAKFPYQKGRGNPSLYLKYKDKTFKLKGIQY